MYYGVLGYMMSSAKCTLCDIAHSTLCSLCCRWLLFTVAVYNSGFCFSTVIACARLQLYSRKCRPTRVWSATAHCQRNPTAICFNRVWGTSLIMLLNCKSGNQAIDVRSVIVQSCNVHTRDYVGQCPALHIVRSCIFRHPSYNSCYKCTRRGCDV